MINEGTAKIKYILAHEENHPKSKYKRYINYSVNGHTHGSSDKKEYLITMDSKCPAMNNSF